jgi:hypothetical protein
MAAGMIGGGVETDPYFSDVIFVSNFTDLTDVKGHTIAAYGNAAITADGLTLDGAGDYARVAIGTAQGNADFALGTSDFAVEILWKPTDFADYAGLVRIGDDAGGSGAAGVYIQSYPAGGTCWYQSSTYAAFTFGSCPAGTVMTAGTLNHLAITREGNTFRYFVNGVKKEEHTTAITISPPEPTTHGLLLGAIYVPYTPIYFAKGSYRGARVTKGSSRYTADFTPPTSFPEA